jgi:hypothetical protein
VTVDLTLRADYYQIQVLDEESATDLADFWTEEAAAEGIVTANDALAIITSTNLRVDVSVDVLQHEPSAPDTTAGHLVEGNLRVSSGRIVVMGCTDYLPDATRVDVGPGWHRVRAVLSSTQAAAEEPAVGERVRLSIWPVERHGEN